MARRLSRPLALRITWVVLPWGISAHAATVAAWLCAVLAAALFTAGTAAAWLAAVATLHIWYLLDHVDGQLARWRGTASLDGVQLDYLMHHTVNLLVPLGIGYGLAASPLQGVSLALGLVWGLSLLLIGLVNDTRYKAFIERLKSLDGELLVIGGAGREPSQAPSLRRGPLGAAWWLARKACEIHVVMNALTCLALARWLAAMWLAGDVGLDGSRAYLAAMALVSSATALTVIVRSVRCEQAEREFVTWYRVPEGRELAFTAGRWKVEEWEPHDHPSSAVDRPLIS
jgi:phosphatidylglycerophosphate synthase